MARRAGAKKAWVRWRATIAYAILAAGVIVALLQVQHLARQSLEDCVDTHGDLAIRHQWIRVVRIIDRTSLPKTDPYYMDPEESRAAFAKSYRDALKEAGEVPSCIGEEDH